MAKDKKGFVLYADQKDLFNQLLNEKAGELIKFVFSYVNDENPITEDLILNLAFTPIKQQLKRDLEKYEGVKNRKSISGREGNLKRWNLDVYTEYKRGNHSLEDAEKIAESRKTSHTDKVRSHLVAKHRTVSQEVANIAVNDTVNVKDNVTVKDINNNNNVPLVKKPKASIDFDKLLDFINKIQKRDGSSRYKIINQKVRSKYKARLKEGYTAEQIKNSIINSSEDKYHLDTNYKYLTPEFFSRSEIIDKHGFKTESKKTGVASKESFISNPYRNE